MSNIKTKIMNGLDYINDEIQTFESKVSASELAEAIKMVTTDLMDELTEVYEIDREDQIELVNGFVLHHSTDGCIDIVHEEDWVFVINCSIGDDFQYNASKGHHEAKIDLDPTFKSETVLEAIKIANRKTFIIQQTVSYVVELEVEADSIEDVQDKLEAGDYDEELIYNEMESNAMDTRETECKIIEKQ